MKHLIVEHLPSRGEVVSLTDAERHYLVDVRRVQIGHRLRCTDGHGRVAETTVVSIEPERLVLEVGADCESREASGTDDSVYEVLLPLLKGKLFDRCVRQATELGAHRIVPLETSRSIKRPAEDEREQRRKQARRQQVAQEACQQCGRLDIPEVTIPQTLTSLLSDGHLPGLVFHEQAPVSIGRAAVEQLWRSTGVRRVMTGPEGGFSDREIELLAEAGWIACRLPMPVLRAETAVVAALAIVLYLGSEYTVS